MATLNKVMLIGNLTRDPVLRYTPKGNAVADIRLAVNRYYTIDGGEKREETTFVDIVLWARQAELAGQYLQKGKPVFIEGRLQLDQWEDKNTGEPRSRIRVVSENMQFLGSAGGGKAGDNHQSDKNNDDDNFSDNSDSDNEEEGKNKKVAKSQSKANDEDVPEDDIPF